MTLIDDKKNGSMKQMAIRKLPKIGLSNRIARKIWQIVWLITCRPTPIFMHRWRIAVLNLFGASVHSQCFIYPNTRIWAPWNLDMDKGSCLASGVDCYNVAPVRLGHGVTVSQRAYLCTASHDFDNPDFPLTGAPIHIGMGCWISAEVFIAPGVTMGAHSVALARTVVTRDVLARMVVAGNPAKEVRARSSILK